MSRLGGQLVGLGAVRTHLHHPRLHRWGDLLDEHPQSWRRRHAPEHEGRVAVVDGQMGEHGHPVVARSVRAFRPALLGKSKSQRRSCHLRSWKIQ